MNIGSEIALTCLRETRRNLRSPKGLIAALLYLLCGALTVLIYMAVAREFSHQGADGLPDEMVRQMRRATLRMQFDDNATVEYLLNAPQALLFLHAGTVVFSPLLITLVGYDQTAGDLQGRTLRYFSGRAHRASLVIGKALAIWIVVGVISLGLDAFAWMLVAYRHQATTGVILAYGLRFWAVGLVYQLAFAGLTAFVSGLFTAPVLALLTNIGALLLWLIVRRIAMIHDAPTVVQWARYLTPGEWDDRLVSTSVGTVALGVVGCVGLCALWLGLASLTLTRRDI